MATVQEYLESLAQTAGLDDESKAGLKKALGNPKFVEELDKSVKRQSDYSRSMDELKTQKQAIETQIQQWREWYDGAVERDAARETELQTLRKGSQPAPVVVTPTDTLTKKEIEEREGRMIQIVKQMGRISSRHAAKFQEELDVDAVEQIAIKNGLTVDKAYEEYIKPRVAEITQKDIEAKIAAAREAGIQEGLSKRDVPGESTRAFHPIFGHSKQVEVAGNLTDAQRSANFAEAWNTAVEKK